MPLQLVDADSLLAISKVTDELWVLIGDELVTVLGEVKMVRHAVAGVFGGVNTDN